MSRSIIRTPNAPTAIGTYSQAVRAGDTVYMSGQIPLDPATRQLVSGDIDAEIRRVFDNLKADRHGRRRHARPTRSRSTVFLTDLAHFAKVNEIMATYFQQPYPARAAVGVAALPRGARVEIECILEPRLNARQRRRCTASAGARERLARSACTRRTCCSCCRSRYEDRTRVTPIGALLPGTRAVVEGEVLLADVVFRRRRAAAGAASPMARASSRCASSISRARSSEGLARGTRLRCVGEVRRGPQGLEMVHPEYRAHRRRGRAAAKTG